MDLNKTKSSIIHVLLKIFIIRNNIVFFSLIETSQPTQLLNENKGNFNDIIYYIQYMIIKYSIL